MRAPLLLLLLVVPLVGCSSQADSSYRGEPLASLHGSVQASAATAVAPPPLEAALLWSGTRPGSDAKVAIARRQVGTSVPVSGQFPAQFTLEIFTPPPEAALFRCYPKDSPQKGSVATASIMALRQGADTSTLTYKDEYGRVQDITVFYVDTDLPAGTECPMGALSKGYHLFKFVPTPDKPGCVRQAPDDPSCIGPWPYTEIPMTTDLSLLLQHEDGTATPPGPSGPPTK